MELILEAEYWRWGSTSTVWSTVQLSFKRTIHTRVIPCTLPIMHMSICTFIIWLAPRMDKMNQITWYDWLPELARWRLPAVSRKKNFLSKQKWNLCFYVAKSLILVVANSFFENWNLYQSSHCMQFTLSLQFFWASKITVFRHMSAGHLLDLCSFSVKKCYVLVVLGTNYLLFDTSSTWQKAVKCLLKSKIPPLS